jgi:hypothetical protein
MADATVPSVVFPAQSSNTRSNPSQSLHLAIIQLPIRKWQRPWQHQRAIALFAASPREMKLRLLREDRVAAGELILQITEAGAR